MINQQRNRFAVPRRGDLFVPVGKLGRGSFGICWPLLLLIKVDEQEYLVLHRGE